MAGAPYGVPAGTIGGKGMDLSPWLAMQQMQMQARQQEAARQMQAYQFQQQQDSERQQQDFNNRITEFRLKSGLEQDKLAREDRLSEIGLRKQESEAGRALQERSLGLQERELGIRQAEGEAREKRGLDLELKGEAKRRALTDARARVAATVGLLAQDAAASTVTPEQVRDWLVQKSQHDPQVADREAEQAAIQEWYEGAVQAKERTTREADLKEEASFRRDREKRIAEDEKLTLELKREAKAEAEDQRRGREASARIVKATAPDVAAFAKTDRPLAEAEQTLALQQAYVGKMQAAAASDPTKLPMLNAAINRLQQYAVRREEILKQREELKAKIRATEDAIAREMGVTIEGE